MLLLFFLCLGLGLDLGGLNYGHHVTGVLRVFR
jgi:hypothetical protein